MAPEPFRGRRNDPGKLYRMAEALSQLLNLTPEQTQRLTFENGCRLYRLPLPEAGPDHPGAVG